MSSKKNELGELPGLRRITKKILLELCKKNHLYHTPYLNDVLYLHYQGFRDIEGLDEYTGLKSLWLECNAISEIDGLTNLSLLKCLFLQHNLIRKIENLHNCRELDTLNLSHNHILNVENCGVDVLPVLTNLNLANNCIRTYDGLKGLLECKMLSVLDLSNNRIDDALIVKIFGQMPELRVLVLNGNPVVGNIPQYRKTIILECKNLTYLDSRPVFPKDRACAEAWKRGGYEEEKAEHDRWVREEHRKMYENVSSLIRLKNSFKKNKEEIIKELSSDDDDESFKTISDTTSDTISDSELNLVSTKPVNNDNLIENVSKKMLANHKEVIMVDKSKNDESKIREGSPVHVITHKIRRRRRRHKKVKGKIQKISNKGNWPRAYKLREEPEAILATSYMYHEILDLTFQVDQNFTFSEENLSRKSDIYKKAYDTYLCHVTSLKETIEITEDRFVANANQESKKLDYEYFKNNPDRSIQLNESENQQDNSNLKEINILENIDSQTLSNEYNDLELIQTGMEITSVPNSYPNNELKMEENKIEFENDQEFKYIEVFNQDNSNIKNVSDTESKILVNSHISNECENKIGSSDISQENVMMNFVLHNNSTIISTILGETGTNDSKKIETVLEDDKIVENTENCIEFKNEIFSEHNDNFIIDDFVVDSHHKSEISKNENVNNTINRTNQINELDNQIEINNQVEILNKIESQIKSNELIQVVAVDFNYDRRYNKEANINEHNDKDTRINLEKVLNTNDNCNDEYLIELSKEKIQMEAVQQQTSFKQLENSIGNLPVLNEFLNENNFSDNNENVELHTNYFNSALLMNIKNNNNNSDVMNINETNNEIKNKHQENFMQDSSALNYQVFNENDENLNKQDYEARKCVDVFESPNEEGNNCDLKEFLNYQTMDLKLVNFMIENDTIENKVIVNEIKLKNFKECMPDVSGNGSSDSEKYQGEFQDSNDSRIESNEVLNFEVMQTATEISLIVTNKIKCDEDPETQLIRISNENYKKIKTPIDSKNHMEIPEKSEENNDNTKVASLDEPEIKKNNSDISDKVEMTNSDHGNFTITSKTEMQIQNNIFNAELDVSSSSNSKESKNIQVNEEIYDNSRGNCIEDNAKLNDQVLDETSEDYSDQGEEEIAKKDDFSELYIEGTNCLLKKPSKPAIGL